MTDTSERFDWCESESIVLREQPATAVYINQAGDIVIRQANTYGDDDDDFIFLRPENVPHLVAAIVDASQQVAADIEDAVEKAPLSNAERQRRYRDRHRNEGSELPLRVVTQEELVS
jgi:hypothetical protein